MEVGSEIKADMFVETKIVTVPIESLKNDEEVEPTKIARVKREIKPKE